MERVKRITGNHECFEIDGPGSSPNSLVVPLFLSHPPLPQIRAQVLDLLMRPGGPIKGVVAAMPLEKPHK
jgi:hypothetical protein